MILQEIFSRLGVKVDRASFSRANAALRGLAGATGKATSKLKQITSMGGVGKYVGAYAIARGFQTAAKDALAFEESLVDLNMASQHTIGPLNEFRKKVFEVSNGTGVAKEEIVDMVRKFVEVTGDGKAGAAAMGQFARIAVASGAAASDVAATAASLNQQLGVMPENMEQAFGVISTAGKLGKVELKDFATFFASVGANFKQFGNSNSVRGLSSVASSLQFVAQNFGTPSEAATGLEQLMGTLLRQAGKLKKEAGIDIYKEDGKTLKDFSQIIFEIAEHPKLQKASVLTKVLGGRKEARLALQALMDNKDAWFDMARQIENADNIATDFNEKMNSEPAKATKTWNQLLNRISQVFTPKRIEVLVRALEKFVDVIEFAIDNAKALLSVWLGIKAATLASSAAAAATGGAGLLASAGKAGALGKAGAVGAGLAIGYGVGTIADQHFGLSDRIAGVNKGNMGSIIERGARREIGNKIRAYKLQQGLIQRPMVAPKGWKGGNQTTNNVNMTVNSHAADAVVVGKAVKHALESEIQTAAAATGAE